MRLSHEKRNDCFEKESVQTEMTIETGIENKKRLSVEEKPLRAMNEELEFLPVRCSTGGCREVYFELLKQDWQNGFKKFACARCGGPLLPGLGDSSVKNPARISFHFWCKPCNAQYAYCLKILRKRCPRCQQWRYLHLLSSEDGIPEIPGNGEPAEGCRESDAK